jgi:hypothetical protein
VVLGGRYGSVTEAGVSYTENEYDYAVERGIPVMGFVPAEPDEIPVGKTDRNDAAAKKLAEFREKVQLKMTRTGRTPRTLAPRSRAASFTSSRTTLDRGGSVGTRR